MKPRRDARSTKLCSLPQTIRLMVRPNHGGDPKESPRLSLGLVVDHAGQRAQERAAYAPIPGKVVAFDLGMATLLATSEGDLLGKGWQTRLERLDSLLQGIARGQQKRGLPVATPRYRALTRQLDGFLKTEIFRMVNAWVARVRPEKIVREALPRASPQASGKHPRHRGGKPGGGLLLPAVCAVWVCRCQKPLVAIPVPLPFLQHPCSYRRERGPSGEG